MRDQQSAGLLLVVGAIAFVVWYRRQSEEGRVRLFGGASHPEQAPNPATPALTGDKAESPTGSYLDRLLAFAHAHGLRVTSTTGGSHTPGSLHYLGRAIDVGGRGLTDEVVGRLREFAGSVGIHVFDERSRPAGESQWSGPHLHLSFPQGGGF